MYYGFARTSTYIKYIYLEFAVVLITILLLIMFFHKWRMKRNNLTVLLLGFYILYGLSILVSALTKLWWYGFNSVGISEDTYIYILFDDTRFINLFVLCANLKDYS
jgi:RsiW-degrading membrane proteinase PrsW (M82 family)